MCSFSVEKQNKASLRHSAGDAHQLTRDSEPIGTTMIAAPSLPSPLPMGPPTTPSLAVQHTEQDNRVQTDRQISPVAIQVSQSLLQPGSVRHPVPSQSHVVFRQILQRAVLIGQTSQPGNGCLPVFSVPGVPRQQLQFVLGPARPNVIGSKTGFSSSVGNVEWHQTAAAERTQEQNNSAPDGAHQD
jgi:hypothetical protein